MMPSSVASFPMYANSHNEACWRQLWGLIRDALRGREIAAPEDLTAPEGLFAHWSAPGLVLSQTCSKPYRDTLKGQVRILGAIDFGLEGCPPGYYRSAIVMRKDAATGLQKAMSGGRIAINSSDSQSGAVVLRRLGASLDGALETGSHWASIVAVAEGRADIAAIDANSWRMAGRYEDLPQLLEVVEWTRPTPGLPLITAAAQPAREIGQVVGDVIEGLPQALAGELEIVGWAPLLEEIYADGSLF